MLFPLALLFLTVSEIKMDPIFQDPSVVFVPLKTPSPYCYFNRQNQWFVMTRGQVQPLVTDISGLHHYDQSGDQLIIHVQELQTHDPYFSWGQGSSLHSG